MKLTEGCLKRILEGKNIDKPIVQILSFKRERGLSTVEISDCVFRTPALLGSPAQELILNTELQHNSLVILEDYHCLKCNTTRGKWWTLVIISMTILEKGVIVGKQIGNPIPATEFRLKGRSSIEKSLLRRARASKTLPIAALNPTNDHWCIKARIVKKGDIQKLSKESSSAIITNSSSNIFATAYNVVRRKFYDVVCKFHDVIAQTVKKGRVQKSNEEFFCMNLTDLSSSILSTVYTIACREFYYICCQCYDVITRIVKQEEFFCMELTDSSGSITATAYNSACLRFYDVVEANKVFLISRFNVQRDETAFRKFKLILKADSKIIPAVDNIQFNFCSFSSFNDAALNDSLDILGICSNVFDLENDLEDFEKKSQKGKFRYISLMDINETELGVMLWDEAAEQFDISTMPVVAIKGAEIVEDSGYRYASVKHPSQIFINPDIKEARQLKNWHRVYIKTKLKSSRSTRDKNVAIL